MLFVGVSANRDWTFEGVKPWELTYRFSQKWIWDGNAINLDDRNRPVRVDGRIVRNGRFVGWNHVWNKWNGRYERAEFNGRPLYPPFDFIRAGLFKAGTIGEQFLVTPATRVFSEPSDEEEEGVPIVRN
jgi:hypothetical protein